MFRLIGQFKLCILRAIPIPLYPFFIRRQPCIDGLHRRGYLTPRLACQFQKRQRFIARARVVSQAER